MILLFSLLFAFLFFILLFLGLTAVLRRRREMAERIQMYSGYRPSVVRKASPFEVNAIKLRILQIFSNRKLLRACGFIMQQNHNKSSHIFNKNY